MCPGHHQKPPGDASYHRYHIREQLARVRPDVKPGRRPNTKLLSFAPFARPSQKQSTGLQSLHTELLVHIFSYLLCSSGGILIGGFITAGHDQGPHSTWFEFENPVTQNRLGVSSGLFLTSRRISDIALDVLYSLNEFSINVKEPMLTRSWLLSIGARNRNRLTRLQFYGIIRTNEYELLKIGSTLQMMRKLNRIHYRPGSYSNPKVATHAVEFDISADEIPYYSRTIMSTYSTKGLPATLRITSNGPYPSPSIREQYQQNSPLLPLPEPILHKIISLCYTDDRIELCSPFNLSREPRKADSIDEYGKSHLSQSSYFAILLVCKSVSRIMRKVIYSSTEFSLRHHAFVVFSDVIRTEDFNRVTRLELVVGQPETERLLYNIQCLKSILSRLLQPSSKIKSLEIKMQRLCVPYLSVFRDSLAKLKGKCQVRLEESPAKEIHRLGVTFNSIGWMLDADIDPNTTWAWGHWSKKWKNLPAVENDVVMERRWKKIKKGGFYVGMAIVGPVGIILLSPIICYNIVGGTIKSRTGR
ncbi:hypothetical protein TWF225_003411 [Orbilia oligospora]|nr:hypothetical protein TWF225_003411 [Orbilia oligospora]KAF3250053.1 hypothetical protein TWF128_007635 [Orbilia oligospora]KAF3263210.1 hypothetical protein TWF217_003650 [Orbilia oligospora]